MIVIDGLRGKNLKLIEILKEKETTPENALIIDLVDVPGLSEFGKIIKMNSPTIDEVIKISFDFIRRMKSIKYVILEVNAPRSKIEYYKKMENLIGKKIIVTIQCPESECMDDIKVYEV